MRQRLRHLDKSGYRHRVHWWDVHRGAKERRNRVHRRHGERRLLRREQERYRRDRRDLLLQRPMRLRRYLLRGALIRSGLQLRQLWRMWRRVPIRTEQLLRRSRVQVRCRRGLAGRTLLPRG